LPCRGDFDRYIPPALGRFSLRRLDAATLHVSNARLWTAGRMAGGSVALAGRRSGGKTPVMRTAHQPRRSIPPRSAFAGFRFPSDVIVLAVRWYLRYGLSYRDVEELLTERGVEVEQVTVYRWVLRFTPLLADAARPCRHAVGDRWQVDET
jgi:hypothetical protein